jgi:mannose-1-phosphate guanylyltransferase
MFVFKASVYLAALDKANPDIIKCCQQSLDKAQTDLDFIRVDKVSFEQCPDDSIDYAIMDTSRENSAGNSTGSTDNVVVVPMDATWSDVGSWSALWDIINKDQHGNTHVGDVISINSKNNLVHSKDKLVATIGLDNIVIVETNDALLVADQEHVQHVKKVVEQLKSQQRSEHTQHREVQRPWGCYDSIDNGKRYQVKRITVKPCFTVITNASS